VVDNGIKRRALPVDFPPWSTVDSYFAVWAAHGDVEPLVDILRERVRLAEGHPHRGGHRLSVGAGGRECVAVEPRLRRR